MSERAPHTRIAEELRAQDDLLDDVTRARMERSLVQIWRTRASLKVPLPSERPKSRGVRVLWGASLAASAVMGALVAFYLFADRAPGEVQVGSARFELRLAGGVVQSGAVAERQVLESGELGAIDIDLGVARVQMARATRVRIERLSAAELTLGLTGGHIDVDFHPLEKGKQRLAIEAPAARVLVVGTRFSVDVDAMGNTQVRVQQGVVEVEPRSGAALRRVVAGEQVYVRVDDGDDYERAVRDSIEESLDEEVLSEPDMDLSDALDTEASASSSAEAAARRLTTARRLLRQGRHTAARERLRGLAENGTAVRFRVEALTLIAESYTAQGDVPHAAAAYKRAEQIAPTQASGHNARFALARLLERYARDKVAAALAYENYLLRAPGGALALQARQALCRLGRVRYCE